MYQTTPEHHSTPTTPPLLHTRLLRLAEKHPRRAVRLAQRLLERAEGSAEHAWAAYVFGYAQLRYEHASAARESLEQALQLFQHQADHNAMLLCRLSLLQARQLAGEGSHLQDAWNELVADCEQAQQWKLLLQARNEQIAHLNLLGRPSEARALAQQQPALLQLAGDEADRARYAMVMSVTLTSCGELDAAAEAADQALEIFRALNRPIWVARVLVERAWIWLRREQFELTRADLQAALTTFWRFDLPLRIGFCERELGVLASLLGDYPTSIAHTLQARTLFAQAQRRDLAAGCDMNLGALAYYSGLYDLAALAYRYAQQTYHKLGNQRLSLGSERTQAMLMRVQGQPEAALEMLRELEPAVLAMGDQLEYAELLLEQACALRQCGENGAAFEKLQRALSVFVQRHNRKAIAECLVEQGLLHLDLHELPEACACFREALPDLVERPAHAWLAHHGLGRACEQIGDLDEAWAQYRTASSVVAKLRNRIISEHASSALFSQASQLYQDTLRLALRREDLAALVMVAEEQRAVVLQQQLLVSVSAPPPSLQALRDRLRDRLRSQIKMGAPSDKIDATMRKYVSALIQSRHYSNVTLLNEGEPFDLERLRERLNSAYGHDWTLLTTQQVDQQILMICITADQLTCTSTPFDSELQELIERACHPKHRLTTFRDLALLRGKTSTPWAVLRALANRLLAPELRARLHPRHRLLIVPTGPLHAIPWAALHLGDAWLAERAILQLLPSLDLQVRDAKLPSRSSSALLIGCETFGGRARDLPVALESLKQVAELWPGPTVRLAGEAANRNTINEMAADGGLQQYELVHIATHAQFNAAHGLLGHIKLADDDLLVDEVLRLGLGGALVLLAACEGAAGELLPGDEVLGIGRALVAAGASTVVASLWPIYDLAVPVFLDTFYRQVVQGDDAPTALAEAQRQLIACSEAEHPQAMLLRSPFVWACLCVTGLTVTRQPEAGGTLPAQVRSVP
jgi:CHAT domain-containing protein